MIARRKRKWQSLEFNSRLKNTNKCKRVGHLVEADEIVFFFNRKKVEKVVEMNFKIKENLLIKTIQRHLNNVSKNVYNGSGLSSFILMKVFLQ